MRRSYDFADFPASRVLASKKGRRISVCLPARDEEETIGSIVRAIRNELMEPLPIVDDVVVIDDGSQDSTAAVAAAAGARVVDSRAILPEYGPGPGKGQAMWKGVHVTSGDVVVFCDADIRDFDPRFVLGLVGPLLARDDVTFVKGAYERPLDGRPGEGGRVTELMAKPTISVFFPHLSDLAQPLSGECAARRDVLESVPFVEGYGVDLGLLIDVTERFGNSGLVQCHLGERVHRNRPLAALGPQAHEVLTVAVQRAGIEPFAAPGLNQVPERPPLQDVPAHRMTA